MSEILRRATPVTVAGVSVALSAGTLAVAGLDHVPPREFLAGNQANTWLAGLAFGLVGAAILRDHPGHPLGRVIAAGGGCAALSAFGFELAQDPARPLTGAAAWAASVLWLPAFLAMVLVVPLLFPDGRPASPRWRWPARAGLGAAAVGVVALATTQEALDSSGFEAVGNPLDLPLADGPQLMLASVALLGALLVGLAATVAVLARMRRVPAPERGRYAWFATAVLLALVTLLPAPDLVDFALNVAAVVALAIGITRHRLFDIEPVLSRTLVYALLSAAAVAVYLAAAVAVGEQARTGVLPALLIALTALLLARVQGRVLAAVSRLLYGDRAAPDTALARLGDRLGSALTPDQVLPASVEAVRRTLRLPYAAIALAGEDGPACAAGTAPAATASFPLVHAGEDVGVLTVGLRAGERDVAPADRELLTRFARQVAVAAHGVRATRDLRRSREQLVSTREAERARIHRDLHDGLGPALAGISLGLETATRAATRDGRSAAKLLEELRSDTAACVEDVRRIVADLRPPALDHGGLAGALRRQGELLEARTGGGLTVLVEADAVDRLPGAVEVAAFRIASEAMTNAARHARAARLTVALHRAADLELVVADDGTGRPPDTLGTGLASMRQRAEELGGSCTATVRPGRGTTVRALLPLGGSGQEDPA